MTQAVPAATPASMGRVITGMHVRVTGYVEGVLKLSSDDCLFLGELALRY